MGNGSAGAWLVPVRSGLSPSFLFFVAAASETSKLR